MKKFLITLMFIMMSVTYVTASANEFVDNTDEKGKLEYVDTTSYRNLNYIWVNMPSKIRQIESDSFNIVIRSKYNFLQDNISYSIDDDFLRIKLNSRYLSPTEEMSPDDIQIFIYGPKFLQIKTTSSLLVSAANKSSLTNYEKD